MGRIFAFFAVASVMVLSGFGGEHAFDLRPRGFKLAMAAAKKTETDGLLRRTALGAGATETTALAVGDRVTFRLFDDVETALVLKERVESPLGGDCFLATADGNKAMTAVVLQTADGLTVDVTDVMRGRVYSVVSTADGVTVRETDPAAGTVLPDDTVVPDLSDAPKDAPLTTALATEQSSTLIDVLVAFDRNATTWANANEGGITNFATMAVQKMNTAIGNTGLSSKFRFRLVGVMAVDADGGSDLDGTLSGARYGTGDWAPVKAMRETVGADTVTVLIDTGSAYGTTGLGYSLSNPSYIASFSESAYNVCAIRAVAQSHTMTHETGHNLGAGHSDRQTDSPGPQLYSYSAGYYFTANETKCHTIMAYNSDGHGNTYMAVPYFSSPDYAYEGVTVGDATHDNTKTISNTYATAAQWRAQVIPMSYDVYFSPESGSTFTDSITVTLTPGKAGLPIRYTLDGSVPTTSSTLYTAPITLTQTTTIRAVTVTDGVAGPVFEATYSASDLGAGVDAPQLVWRTSADYPWTFQTSETFDGVDAVKSGVMPKDGYKHNSWLETDVTGPTVLSFAFKRGYMYYSVFSVSCDGVSTFSFDEDGTPNDWQQVEVNVPAGKHVVRFNFQQWGYYSDVFNGIYLDQVRFDALSRPPTISPETTSDESTATTFQGTTTVTLTKPAGRTGSLYYTLDGSDPTGDGAVLYDGPITLTKSTHVRAVFVEGGKDPSVEVGGLYLERHPVKPGEWTTDVEGVKTAAAQNGRLIAVLCADYATCGWCQAFDPVANSKEFLSWAEANGVYLVTADQSLHCDAQTADDWVWTLHWSTGSSSGISYPTLYFAQPASPETAIGKGLARNDGQCKIGTVLYNDTVEALIAGFASVLGENVPAAPTSSDATVPSFPVNVTLSNPNGSGDIYYTLDGSAPTKANGTKYTGAIAIASSGTVLKVVVWPSSGASSPVLMQTFKTYADVLGTSGVTWTTGGDYLWQEDAENSGTMKTAYVSGRTYTSWIQGVVTGKGRLVFTLKGSSNSGYNTIAFSVNGTQQYSYGYNYTDGKSKTRSFVQEVTTTGTTTFKWTYTVEDSGYHYSSNGAWLYDVQWIPEGSVFEPGEEKTYGTAAAATEAAANINAHKETMIQVPAAAEATKAAYLARVEAKASGSKVVVGIAADAVATFESELNDELQKSDVSSALIGDAGSAEVSTVAGFYYWVVGGTDVTAVSTPGTAVMGDGTAKTLAKPTLDKSGGAAFYKLSVGVKEP